MHLTSHKWALTWLSLRLIPRMAMVGPAPQLTCPPTCHVQVKLSYQMEAFRREEWRMVEKTQGPTVLGCYQKMVISREVETTDIYFSQFLRLGGPRSRCGQNQCLVRVLFMVCRHLPSHSVLTWLLLSVCMQRRKEAGGRREMRQNFVSLPLFIRTLIPSWGSCSHDLIVP